MEDFTTQIWPTLLPYLIHYSTVLTSTVRSSRAQQCTALHCAVMYCSALSCFVTWCDAKVNRMEGSG